MNKVLLGVIALPTLGFAGCWQMPELETRTFALDHLDYSEAASLVEPYIYAERERRPGPGTMSAMAGAITVRETEDNLERIEQVLREFDRPVKDLRFRFQLIEANGFTDTDAEIRDVVQELEGLFRFEGYHLMAEAIVTTAIGSSFSQVFSEVEGRFSIQGNVHRSSGEGVWLDVNLNRPGLSLLGSSVTVRPGQTIVLGSGPRSEESSSGTVILVMRVDEAP